MAGFGEGREDAGWGEIVGGRVRGFEHPVGGGGVGDEDVVPFDLQVAWGQLEEGRAWEGERVEGRFGGHGLCLGIVGVKV